MFYSHVCIMIVVGFGYLMTFLKRYNYSAVSYNFMLAAFVFLWNQVVRALWLPTSPAVTLRCQC